MPYHHVADLLLVAQSLAVGRLAVRILKSTQIADLSTHGDHPHHLLLHQSLLAAPSSLAFRLLAPSQAFGVCVTWMATKTARNLSGMWYTLFNSIPHFAENV